MTIEMQRKRITVLVLLVILGFSAVSARLYWLQALQWREFHLRAENFQRRVQTTPAPRGRILDRDGQVISQDEPTHEIVYNLSQLEPVRWLCRRTHRVIRRTPSGHDFPYDVDTLWNSIDAIRASLRPQFAKVTRIPPQIWLSRLSLDSVQSLSSAIASRPRDFPGLEVLTTRGEVWIDPNTLFAGEIAVRSIERRLDLVPGSLFNQVWKTYQSVSDPDLSSTRREEIYRYLEHHLVGNITDQLAEDIVTNPEHYPGLRVREVPRRSFFGPAGIARLIGRVGARRPDDERRWKQAHEPIVDRLHFRTLRTFLTLQKASHHSEDLVGHDGIEQKLEDQLRGRSGGQLVILDHRQNMRGEPLDVIPPTPGEDVALTLDLDLCRQLQLTIASRDPHGGSALIANVQTGEILGWCSYPAATPDVYRDIGQYRHLQALGRGHFFDRPVNYPLEPGSTFKTVVALAALEEGVVDPAEKITCTGVYDPANPHHLRCNNHTPYLDLDLQEALLRSCNVYFYKVGGDRLGLDKLSNWSETFQFWKTVNCGAGFERVGVGPRSSPHSVSIGQAFTTTPIQMLRLTAMIAQRGRAPRLTVLQQDVGKVVEEILLRSTTWDQVIRAMERTVQDPNGTAAKPHYGLQAFDCAVKTGSAEVPTPQIPPQQRFREWNHAWLIGFTPVQNPLYALVIALERVEGHGGEECAPIAAEILNWLAENRAFDGKREGRQ